MPAESSIYWNSVDSQRSTSGGSSADACSSGSANRHYVDPWDLENYAYLRRHSVAGLTQQASRQHRRSAHRLSHDARARSEYWYSSSAREPGYDAPAFVEELYCGPPRPTNNSCYYHQPIYEDEVPDYVAPFPVYAPLPELRHDEADKDHRPIRQRCKSTTRREVQRAEYVDPRIPVMDGTELEICKYAIRVFEQNSYQTPKSKLWESDTKIVTLKPTTLSEMRVVKKCLPRQNDIPRHRSESEYRSIPGSPEQEKYMAEMVPPPHFDLNTYGHLKIDYTNSWNSLNRKISK